MKNKVLKTKIDKAFFIIKLVILDITILPCIGFVVGIRASKDDVFGLSLMIFPLLLTYLVFLFGVLSFVKLLLSKTNLVISIMRTIRGVGSIFGFISYSLILIDDDILKYININDEVFGPFLFILAVVLFVLSIAEFIIVLLQEHRENKCKKQ